ncbi:hypothetical protein SNEBB_003905 [Seison nebaliae]|nr:hypothetical protein SNEBB_003905 [Seison nebaliae]
MPKYYCDYCDTYLTHDSPSVRKTHNQGKNHKGNVREYYQKWLADQAQRLIDQTIQDFGRQEKLGLNNPTFNSFPTTQTVPMMGGMPMPQNSVPYGTMQPPASMQQPSGLPPLPPQ